MGSTLQSSVLGFSASSYSLASNVVAMLIMCSVINHCAGCKLFTLMQCEVSTDCV
jgi:hypothetical protein